MNQTHDPYGDAYSKAERYVRKVMKETEQFDAPKVYTERAKRFLEASKHGVILNPMQIAWAEKVLRH